MLKSSGTRVRPSTIVSNVFREIAVETDEACIFRLKNRGRFLELRLLTGFLFFQRFNFFERHFETQRKFRFERRRVILAENSGLEQFALVELRD